MKRPTITNTVKDVRPLPGTGPWSTKSGGELNVLFGIPFDDIQGRFLHYDPLELQKIPHDIRGLRSYRVSGLKEGAVGAHEWHRVRNELIFAIGGRVELECEDINHEIVRIILDESTGAWVPPYILHTYTALEDDSKLLVVASTLFMPGIPDTHDTYSAESFGQLQGENPA